jgi:hypothetical protein
MNPTGTAAAAYGKKAATECHGLLQERTGRATRPGPTLFMKVEMKNPKDVMARDTSVSRRKERPKLLLVSCSRCGWDAEFHDCRLQRMPTQGIGNTIFIRTEQLIGLTSENLKA